MKKTVLKTFCTLSLLLLFCGCGNRMETSYTPVSFEEPYGEVYNEEQELGICIEHGKGTYYFPATISEDEAKEYVEEMAQLIKLVEKVAGKRKETFFVYVCDEAYRTRVEGDTLYCSYETYQNVEQAVGAAWLLLGNWANYGLVYGLGMDVASTRGYETEPVGELAEALSLCDTAPEYLDLNYACFSEYYADAETIDHVKTIAVNLYEYIKEQKKTDVVKNYSDVLLREHRNDFLTTNGKTEYNNSDLDGIAVYGGGNALRLIWEDAAAKYHIDNEFKENHLSVSRTNLLNGLYIEEDLFNSGYANLRELIVLYQESTQFVRKKLIPYGRMPDRVVSVVFTTEAETYENGNGGAYFYTTDEIHVYSAMAFQHEYVHSMLHDRHEQISRWLNECIANYFEYYIEQENNYSMLFDEVSTKSLSPDTLEEKERYDFEMAVRQQLGHEVDWTSREDYIYVINAYIAYGDRYDDIMTGGGPATKYSFTNFLVSKAGEEATIQAILDNKPKDAFGAYWLGLVEEWESGIREEFQWVEALKK